MDYSIKSLVGLGGGNSQSVAALGGKKLFTKEKKLRNKTLKRKTLRRKSLRRKTLRRKIYNLFKF